jgi:protein-L-isoaspartate(D-aspartate) O-methyltransferase
MFAQIMRFFMNQKLYDFFKSLDRSYFVEGFQKQLATLDRALPIGYQQTITQPSLVLEMSKQLQLHKHSKVLEIGTGSGYQTAFLAEFAKTVYTIERIEPLAILARKRLEGLGYQNVHYRVGDGSLGWKEHAPYDRIIVTAAAGNIPDELINQLDINGRMIIPVGNRGLQDLMLVTKDQAGNIHSTCLEKVAFVEMKGKYGWNEK